MPPGHKLNKALELTYLSIAVVAAVATAVTAAHKASPAQVFTK